MLPRLLDHLIWADRRTAEALATLGGPDADLLRGYGHILAAEAVWLTRIAEQPNNVSVWPSYTLDECLALGARNHAEFERLARDVEAGVGERVVTYTNSRGESFSNTVSEILHHVCLHGMYHRGQVMQGVRERGGTPLATDFIVYARGK